MAPLTPEAALEVTRIRSAAGFGTTGALATTAPFRAPITRPAPWRWSAVAPGAPNPER
ncbi:MAG: ATP-binding protein [Acidimicrobiia bacterium]|nr:ATP-binding protein [Acidimicrobiia bacterium]